MNYLHLWYSTTRPDSPNHTIPRSKSSDPYYSNSSWSTHHKGRKLNPWTPREQIYPNQRHKRRRFQLKTRPRAKSRTSTACEDDAILSEKKDDPLLKNPKRILKRPRKNYGPSRSQRHTLSQVKNRELKNPNINPNFWERGYLCLFTREQSSQERVNMRACVWERERETVCGLFFEIHVIVRIPFFCLFPFSFLFTLFVSIFYFSSIIKIIFEVFI